MPRDPVPPPTLQEANKRLRLSQGDIRDTINRTRDLIRQSRESVARADRVLAEAKVRTPE